MLGLLLLLALFLESASFIDGFLRFVLLAFSLIRHFLESGLLIGKSCIPGLVVGVGWGRSGSAIGAGRDRPWSVIGVGWGWLELVIVGRVGAVGTA